MNTYSTYRTDVALSTALKVLCHEDTTVLGQFCDKSALAALTNTQNAPVEF